VEILDLVGTAELGEAGEVSWTGDDPIDIPLRPDPFGREEREQPQAVLAKIDCLLGL